MKKKKAIVSLLISMVVAIQLNINTTFAYADVNNGISEETNKNKNISLQETNVKDIHFNKNELKIGETLEVYADVENIPTGSSVYAHFWFPQNQLHYELKYNEESGFYTSSIEIEERFKYKTIDLIGIEVRNQDGTVTTYKSDLFISISDENGVLDKSNPIIDSVKVNKNEFMVGEDLEVLVSANDDISGVKEVKSSLNINGQYHELKFSYDEVMKIYKSYFKMTEDLKYKTIKLSSVLVTDNAERSMTWEGDITISVLEETGNKDIIKPTVKSAQFDKEQYKTGETLRIYVDAYDNESGILSVDAYIKMGSYTKHLVLQYNEELKKYFADAKINEGIEGSKIKLVNLIVTDNAYNKVDFKEGISAYILTKDGQVDKAAPEITDIKFSKDKLMLKDKLEITLNASDDISGIDEVKLNASIGNEKLTYSFSKVDENNNYKLEIKTKENMHFKDLKIESIEAFDFAGNINNIEINKVIPVVDEARIITDDTSVEEVIQRINDSKENKIEFLINTKDKIIDKEIFKIISGTNKSISFIQEDGTVWTFAGKNIKNENIDSINLSVSNKPSEAAKAEIEKLTKDSIFVNFSHHGNLLGRASVKLLISDNKELSGKVLTLYYYNMESGKIEKVKNNILVDKNGYVVLDIDHCSDYFLSLKGDLLDPKVDNTDKTNESTPKVENTNAVSNLPNTGGINTTYVLIGAVAILVVGSVLVLKRKRKA